MSGSASFDAYFQRKIRTVHNGMKVCLAGAVLMLLCGSMVTIVYCFNREKGRATASRRAQPAIGAALFADVTADSGIDFSYRNGEAANNTRSSNRLAAASPSSITMAMDCSTSSSRAADYSAGLDSTRSRAIPVSSTRTSATGSFSDVTAEVGLDSVGGSRGSTPTGPPWRITTTTVGPTCSSPATAGWPCFTTSGMKRRADAASRK